MNRKIIGLITAVFIIAFCFVGTVSAYDQPSQDSSGNYLIGTVSNLQWFSEQVNAGNTGYNAKVTANINLKDVSFTAIGTSSNPYSGTFNGNGKKISNLSGADVSIFGYVSGATIRNIMLDSFTVTSSTIYGCLIKQTASNSYGLTVDSCAIVNSVLTSTGTTEFRAMLIGSVTCTGTVRITNCYADSCTHNVAAIRCSGLLFGGENSNSQNHVYWNNCYTYNCDLVNSGDYNGGLHAFIVGQSTGWSKPQYTYSCVVIGGSINMTAGTIHEIKSPDSALVVGYQSESTHLGGLYYASDVNILSQTSNFASYATSSKSNGQLKSVSEIQAANGAFFTTSSNWDSSYQWDFTNTWYWDSNVNLPRLQVFLSEPQITAVAVTSTTPAEIGSTVSITATLSNAPATDAGTVTFYTSTTPAVSSSWASVGSQQISAQSAAGVISLSFTGSSTAATYYVKAILADTTQSVTYDSYTDGSITNVFFVLQYADPIPNTPGGPLQPIGIPYTITLTASCSNEITVASYVWQLQSGSSWSNVSTGSQYTTKITTPGNHVYRFLAIGKNGNIVPSTSITVNAGYAPSATITSPETGTLIDPGSQLTLEATIGGTAGTYTWDFGDGVSSHGTSTGTVNSSSQSITSYVVYTSQKGTRDITLTVSNVYGTTATYKIYIENGKGTLRPAATSTVKPVDSSGIYNLINDTKPTSYENQMPNLSAIVSDITAPMTSIIGEWFYLILFAVPYLIIFLRQKNILIPSILGVLFAAWLLVFLPGAAMKAAIGILILCVAGGIIGLYVKRQS